MNIAIVGAGGLGSHLVSLLYEYGNRKNQFSFLEYKFTVWDDDRVDDSNLLHQNYFEEDLGKLKVEILADRYCIDAVAKRLTTTDELYNYDVVFSCVDNLQFRKMLYFYGWEHPDLFWIDGRCNSRIIAVYNSLIPKAILKKSLQGEEAKSQGCLREVDKAKRHSHVTPLITAGIMVQWFLNFLRKENISEPIQLLV